MYSMSRVGCMRPAVRSLPNTTTNIPRRLVHHIVGCSRPPHHCSMSLASGAWGVCMDAVVPAPQRDVAVAVAMLHDESGCAACAWPFRVELGSQAASPLGPLWVFRLGVLEPGQSSRCARLCSHVACGVARTLHSRTALSSPFCPCVGTSGHARSTPKQSRDQ